MDRESILSASDTPKLEAIDVAEWGGKVYIKVMSGSERDRWEIDATHSIRSKNLNIRAILCVLTVCDKDGKRIFKDDDAQALGEKSSIILDKVFQVARRVNKLTDDDLQELEGN